MKYAIIIPFICVVVSCQKDTELATANDLSYLVYDEEMNCRPIVTENGFYTVSTTNELSNLVFYKASGEKETIYDVSSLFSDDKTIDSVSNLVVSINVNGNLLVAYSYLLTDTTSAVQAIEISDQGELIDEFNFQIPTTNNLNFEFQAINKNQNNEWVLLSSAFSMANGPGATPTTRIQISKKINETELENTVFTYEGFGLGNSFSLANGAVAIPLAQIEIGSGPNQEVNEEFSSILFVNSSADVFELQLTEALNYVSLIRFYENELTILGTLSSGENETNVSIQTFDENYTQILTLNTTVGASFIPTCCYASNNNYTVGGFFGEARNFSWDNVYNMNGEMNYMFSIGFSNSLLWQKQFENNFSGVVLNVTEDDGNLSWLLAKNSFGVYQNIAIMKTDFNGNLK